MAEILRYPLPRAVAEAVHLLLLERAVALFLSEESLKIFRQALDGLVGELFSARDELVAIGLVVRHVVPLDRELVARRQRLAGGEELRDAKHLLKSVRVVTRRR